MSLKTYIICHLSYVSTLHDISQKPKCDTDELKQRLTDTYDVFLRTSSMKPLTSGKHGYMHM